MNGNSPSLGLFAPDLVCNEQGGSVSKVIPYHILWIVSKLSN